MEWINLIIITLQNILKILKMFYLKFLEKLNLDKN
jgi:hypothetical protein